MTVADESDLVLKWFSFSMVTTLFPSVVSLLVCFISYFFFLFLFLFSFARSRVTLFSIKLRTHRFYITMLLVIA